MQEYCGCHSNRCCGHFHAGTTFHPITTNYFVDIWKRSFLLAANKLNSSKFTTDLCTDVFRLLCSLDDIRKSMSLGCFDIGHLNCTSDGRFYIRYYLTGETNTCWLIAIDIVQKLSLGILNTVMQYRCEKQRNEWKCEKETVFGREFGSSCCFL